MKLVHLKIEGFRGFRECLDIDIDEGFVIITGRNGAGKSTICDALEFALTGSLSRFEAKKSKEEKETVADYVWWRGTGEPQDRLVELTFRTDDGELIPVVRRPETSTVDFDEKYSRLFCETASDARSLGEIVRTMLLRDETIAGFSIDLPEEDRFIAVERALGVAPDSTREAVVVEAATLADARLKDARRAYESVRGRVLLLTEEVSRRRGEMVPTAALIAAEETLRTELGISPSAVIDTDVAQGQLANLRSKISEVQRDYQALLEELRHVEDIEAQKSDRKIADARVIAERTEAVVNAIEADLRLLEQEEAAATKTTQERGVWAQLVAAGERIGLIHGSCPLCSSAMSPEQFANEIARIHRMVTAEAESFAATLARKAEVRTALANVRTRHQEANRLIDGIERSRAGVSGRIGNLTRHLSELTGIDEPNADGIREWLQERTADVARTEAALTVMVTAKRVERVADLEDQLAAATREADLAATALTKFERAIDLVKNLSRTVRQVTKEVADERLAAASPVLEELYRRLRPHSEWRDVSYSVRGQVKKMLTFRVGDDLNPKFVFSSGQRRAAGLAFLLAVHLARNWCRLNTLVLDDPVQHIDDFRALHLVEVLAAIRKTGRQIICTVEDPALADLLVRRLQVAPLSGGSRLELRNDPLNGSVVESHRRFFALPQDVLLSSA